MEKIAFIFLTQIDNHTNIENSVNQELFIINSILIDCDRFMNLESIQDKISILSLKKIAKAKIYPILIPPVVPNSIHRIQSFLSLSLPLIFSISYLQPSLPFQLLPPKEKMQLQYLGKRDYTLSRKFWGIRTLVNHCSCDEVMALKY